MRTPTLETGDAIRVEYVEPDGTGLGIDVAEGTLAGICMDGEDEPLLLVDHGTETHEIAMKTMLKVEGIDVGF